MKPFNWLAWEPVGKDCTIVGRGPSMQILVDDPTLAVGPVVAAGGTAKYLPNDIDYAVSYHDHIFLDMMELRRSKGWNVPPCIGYRNREIREGLNYFYYRPALWPGGSSALLSLEIMYAIGYEVFHVFGVDLTGHHEVFRPNWSIVLNQPDLHIKTHGESLSWLKI